MNFSALQGRWREATEGSHVHKDILYVCVRGRETPQARWAGSPTRRSSSFSQVLLHPRFIMGFCLRHRAADLAKPELRCFPRRAILGLYGQCV